MEYARPANISNALKNAFGVGGGTVDYPDGTRGLVQFDAKGITLAKGPILTPDARTRLSWAQARDRLTDLIMSGRYGAEFSGVFYPREPSGSEAAPEVLEIEPDQPDDPAEKPKAAGENYRIPDERRDYGGPKTRFRNNAAAIRTMKEIEAEGRAATEAEQEILSRYVGWGGLPQAFDERNDQWSGEYAELKELLSDDEYRSAEDSILNAHYTSPTVIKAIYKALGGMGYEDGPGKKILEPAMGIGNFFGLVPDGMKDTKLYGVELDSVSGRIARQLYPSADIRISGFEKTDYPEGYFNAVIGNVPFGGYGVADPKYDQHSFLIHDYFLAKSLDLVRPGGVVAVVTSMGTMDKARTSVRKYLARRAELLGAVRLPNNAFKENAGTEVTADIIFLRKRRERVIDVEPDWVHLDRNKDGIAVNSYFAEHPEMILGRHDKREQAVRERKDLMRALRGGGRQGPLPLTGRGSWPDRG
jgi:adenine-specific DNA methylase